MGGPRSRTETDIQAHVAVAGRRAIHNFARRQAARPTITYVPMTGEKFLHGLITPIDPKNIFFMLQTGYAADFILALTVESLNGVRNRSADGRYRAGGGPGVHPRAATAARGAGCRRVRDACGGGEGRARPPCCSSGVRTCPPDIAEKTSEIRRLLKLPADQQKFTLVYSPVRGAENELTVNSRSMLQILSPSRARRVPAARTFTLKRRPAGGSPTGESARRSLACGRSSRPFRARLRMTHAPTGASRRRAASPNRPLSPHRVPAADRLVSARSAAWYWPKGQLTGVPCAPQNRAVISSCRNLRTAL